MDDTDQSQHSDDPAQETHGTSKYANTHRGPRIRGYGEGTLYKFERKLPSGNVWRGYRAKRSIKHGQRTIRITGQGVTRQLALENLDRNIVRKRVALGELPQSYLKLNEVDEERTIEGLLDEWLARQRREIRYNSWKGYDAKVRNYLKPAFGSLPVRLLTTDNLETYFTVTLPSLDSPTTGKPLGKTAIRQTYWTFNASLNYALKRGWIDRNPLLAVDPPPRNKPTKQEAKDLRQSAQYAAQYTLQKIQGDEDESRWLLAFMGLRQSEVLGLRTSSLKRKERGKKPRLIIDRQLIHESASHGCGSYDAKTGKWACGKGANRCPQRTNEPRFVLTEDLKTEDGYRALPLTDRMYRVLKAKVDRQHELQKSADFDPLKGKDFDDLLFTSKIGKPRRHQDDRESWKQLLSKLNLQADLRLHHARHFAVTMLIEQGRTDKEIQNILGWSKRTVDTMIATYGHADEVKLLEDPMEALDREMFTRVKDEN